MKKIIENIKKLKLPSKILICVWMFCMFVVTFACAVGTEGNLTFYSKWEKFNLEGAKISFLGDSITTFYSSSSPVNSLYSGENQYYYPIYSGDVKTVAPAVPVKNEIKEYKIQRGDTFTHLSRKFYGSIRYYRQLMEYNKISNPNSLRVGKIIKVPPLEILKGEK